MRPRFLLRVAVFLLLPAALAAEPPAPMPPLDLSLQECVALAVQNNLAVRLAKAGTAAKVRVIIESADKTEHWGTIGVSENIVDASWQALVDSIEYKLLKSK